MRSPDKIGISWEENQLLMQQLREKAALENRRQHNIYEAGDLVVWINSIAPNDPRLFEVEDDLGEKPDTWSLRHATNAEIEAGKRLEVE